MGQWNAYTGSVVMTPHPQLSDDAIKAMVEWVLSRTPVEPPKA
jgi:cytochrome c551/c552